MITRFYYTLQELQNGSISPALQGWDTIISNITGETTTDTLKQAELYNFCKDEYRGEAVVYIDIVHPKWEVVEQPTIAEIKTESKYAEQYEELKNQVYKIKNWLSISSVRYEKLIEVFSAQENNLMKQLESSVQFNDTPQTSASGLDADNYATTYTKSKADAGTVLQRLNEVRNLWDNVYDDWVREFGRKFVI